MKTDQPIEIETAENETRREEHAESAFPAVGERPLGADAPGDPSCETPGGSMRGSLSLVDQRLLEIYLSGGYY